MTTKYKTLYANFDPKKLEDKIKEIAQEEEMKDFSRYEFTCTWTDSQGLHINEEFLQKGDKRLVLTIKNSWQRDIKNQEQRSLSINND